ncbi:hypothetical protein C7974DRAFT_455669 [Boeremia exigua]|uniref:uncharacterized protein n=1 Tax=Boeremia exigua TaxID=749465 RepID=UPI001E8D77F0|nr:uncharacterized protein C7974DRAFT_455669 [Boeremia exigua]KAH6625505.1 hypothetical protein C7974DRAFT_455669 [Boeremia exigua]
MPNYTITLPIPDQEMPLALTTMWMVFKVEDTDEAASALKAGLKKTATQMPFLSGVLWEDADDDYRTKISWSDNDPSIPCDKLQGDDLPGYDELDTMGMPLHEFKQHDFYGPKLMSTMMRASKKPALYVSYTEIKSGLIVMLAAHHGLVDGVGRENILKILALNVRGLSTTECGINPTEPLDGGSLLDAIKAMALPDTEKEISISSVADAARVEVNDSVHGLSANIRSVLMRWSVRKLEELRSELRQHTDFPFTLSTMVTALLWVLTLTARLHTTQTGGPSAHCLKDECSDLYMACNMRGFLKKAGYLDKTNQIRNLISFLEPHPRIAYDSVLSNQKISLKLSGHAVECPAILPCVVDDITRALSNMNADAAIVRWTKHYPESGFDYRQLRDLSFLFKGTNFDVANWSSLDLLPNFGPVMGHRPAYIRLMPARVDGLAFILPRHRDAICGPEHMDRFDVMMNLKDVDMDEIVQNSIVKAVTA